MLLQFIKFLKNGLINLIDKRMTVCILYSQKDEILFLSYYILFFLFFILQTMTSQLYSRLPITRTFKENRK